MQTQTVSNFYTPEEYLALEEKALEKSEYYNGEIFTMAGGTPRHNRISGNLYIELCLSLKKQSYNVYMADVKLWIPQKNSFNYPDIMVIEGEPEFYENSKDVILNPVIVMEVLSESTADYDRGGKFEQYRSLESLQEYILLSQDKVHIEHFRKTAPHEWLFTEIDDINTQLLLQTIDTAIELNDIYNKVSFS